MLKKIRLFIPELLGVIFGNPARIPHRWEEFKEDMAEARKQEAKRETRRKANEPVMPDVHGCTGKRHPNHLWKYMMGGWNSGIYDNGAIGRSGWKCYHCSNTSWDETDEEFVKSHPDWLLVQATNMPEAFLEYFSIELLQKRVDYRHDKKVREMQHEQQGLRDRLAELDEIEQNGGMLLTGNT